jgi:hypothetical protein
LFFLQKKDTSLYETRCVKIKGEKDKGEKDKGEKIKGKRQKKQTNKREINKAAFFCKLPYLVWRSYLNCAQNDVSSCFSLVSFADAG